jgi:putative FmdB family regulatory protein
MPVYEFFCVSCKKKFSKLCKINDRDKPQICEFCGAETNRRMVSRFRMLRNEEQLLESLADPSKLSGLDENDPGSMADWAKKMAREMGENMDDEIDQMAAEEFSDTSESDDQL